MIKQVVFDFGQVLVHFDPHAMCERYLTNDEDIAVMEAVLFDRLYWDKLDAGTITDEQTITLAQKRLPAHLRPIAADIFYNWIYMLPEIDGMRDVLISLKQNGVPLYLLSNISRYFADHCDEIEILSYFDHCVFSAVCGYTKPHKNIFDHLCRTCDCDPAQTLFIDDSEKNIEGAEKAGLIGYRFDGDATKLRQFLVANGVLADD